MKPLTVDAWLGLLGGEYYPRGPEQREECIARALERLHTGLAREKAAWAVLLGNYGLGRTVRDVKKSLSGRVVWPEEPQA